MHYTNESKSKLAKFVARNPSHRKCSCTEHDAKFPSAPFNTDYKSETLISGWNKTRFVLAVQWKRLILHCQQPSIVLTTRFPFIHVSFFTVILFRKNENMWTKVKMFTTKLSPEHSSYNNQHNKMIDVHLIVFYIAVITLNKFFMSH